MYNLEKTAADFIIGKGDEIVEKVSEKKPGSARKTGRKARRRYNSLHMDDAVKNTMHKHTICSDAILAKAIAQSEMWQAAHKGACYKHWEHSYSQMLRNEKLKRVQHSDIKEQLEMYEDAVAERRLVEEDCEEWTEDFDNEGWFSFWGHVGEEFDECEKAESNLVMQEDSLELAVEAMTKNIANKLKEAIDEVFDEATIIGDYLSVLIAEKIKEKVMS